jgi:NTP pyrophosphatase (non-canonical NTP hydrolase)
LSILDTIEKLNKKYMTFEEYQKLSRKTAIYPDKDNNFIYPTLGLTGEAGEVAEKIKKVLRDNKGVIDDSRKQEIKKELGDVLWYLSQIATELHLSLSDIASSNIEKVNSRQERNKISGEGDNR